MVSVVFKNSIRARQAFDSRGNPTVEAEINTAQGRFISLVPSGASTGRHEALELRDGGKVLGGKGVLKAVKNVNTVIAKKLLSFLNFKKQSPEEFVKKMDSMLCALDGTPNKKKLGANALLACSMSACRAHSAFLKTPLYEYFLSFDGKQSITMPSPVCNFINGGAHAGNALDIQEYLLVSVPGAFKSFAESDWAIAECYQEARKKIKEKYGKTAVNVGDEGGFAPPISDARAPIDLLDSVVRELGYSREISLGLDAASNHFYDHKHNAYRIDGRVLSAGELEDFYASLVSTYSLSYLEDPFHEEAFNDFAKFKKKWGMRLLVVGDDLTVTNTHRVHSAVSQGSCNAIILKLNQVGTVWECFEAGSLARSHDWKLVVSHRSGETEDSFIADYAVGIGAEYIKLGAPCRGERTAKHNELLRIEEGLEK